MWCATKVATSILGWKAIVEWPDLVTTRSHSHPLARRRSSGCRMDMRYRKTFWKLELLISSFIRMFCTSRL